ncbi:GntR family transcriptional regulator [Yinghuangia sp. ASG 101]|uniref:FadR/GntR family transcriptional regulator n=1 Tax=Yinghuangia sp. ASG 101 TaxID=2896848 RepID=UPI001E512AAF|nr:GntR family transcriptional regulator [Yinghuangia sp. ASG 101]UGQ12357.1 GntR family transcriptional regulator [Yinghuangia sp. ASG 101]
MDGGRSETGEVGTPRRPPAPVRAPHAERSGEEPAPSPRGGLVLDDGWTPPHRRRTRKTAHILADGLRRQILSGELEVGRRLPAEAELTATLEVSRDTLREALRILESQSLIEIRRGRGGGAVVRRPGLGSVGRYVALLLQVRRATLADLEEARLVIEPPAAAQFARGCDEKRLDHLIALHDAERAAAKDALSFATAVAIFDQAVTELSGNTSVGVIAGVLRHIYAGQVYAAVDTTDRKSAERFARRVVIAHNGFLEAARRRDGALAEEAWSDYLESASRLMVSRSLSRRPIDVVPMWKAEVDQAGSGTPRRVATAVATEIRSRIADGRLSDGERLPPLADLTREFGLSLPTLREALRILEMELLLDLRPGDRGGATVRHPSAKVAAQLAGTVFEARGTTLTDFSRAVRMIEPAVMELTASRIDAGRLDELRVLEAEVAASVDDTPRFMRVFRNAVMVAFAGTRNPALAVVAQMLQWVKVGIGPAVTVGATSLPWVSTTNRGAHAKFAALVEALADHDAARAGRTWAECLDASAPFFDTSDLGRRLVVDLIE